ncbi:prepilin peptidase [Pantoea dispersa]|uniref:prepilin peptidase n=1 Tax=Pantoea dispersa TaxID=59814 RepID=UPI0039B62646
MLSEIILWLLFALLCLTIGSFLNVVIYRLPLMILQPQHPLSLALPGSHCPRCKTLVRWRDNLPLLGWLMLRGRCRACQQPISLRYPLVEGVALFCGVVLAMLLPVDQLWFTLLLCWTLLALSLIDAEHQLLPDLLTLPLLWAGLLLHCFALLPGNVENAIIGAVAGYLIFWMLSKGYQQLRGIEALGLGDAKLLAALGAWLGWEALPMLVLLAASGAIVTVLVTRAMWQRPIDRALPFGPWLSLAGAGLFIRCLY